MLRRFVVCAVFLVACGDNEIPQVTGECVMATDCPGADTDCAMRACTDGQCTQVLAPAGTAVTAQTAGDCQKIVCDGSGKTMSAADDTDTPMSLDDGCVTRTCVSGAIVEAVAPIGTACGSGLECDGGGTCVHCTLESECPGTDTDCQVRTCTFGACGISFFAPGTIRSAAHQIAGDCQKATCDGAGGSGTPIVDNTDVPKDGNACTSDVCTNGVPSNPDLPARTACGSGDLCDGTGTCVQCLLASDCPGVTTDCAAPACIAGVCGTAFQPSGTLVAAQTPGDCLDQVCDGAGNIVPATDTNDVPNDNNDCTVDSCNGSTPTHTNAAAHTACGGASSSLECDGNGTCVGCIDESECPGHDDQCEQRSCVAGSCGVANTPAGTPLTAGSQVAGDCKILECDGAGNTISQNDDSDTNNDNNDCTADGCSAGNPTHVDLTAETTCAGGVCNGVGACVACVVAADCPGADVGCTVRTCTNNVCGTGPAPDGTPLPDDGNVCTHDFCVAGVAHPPADGVACNDGSPADTRCRDTACVPAVAIARENDATSGNASSVAIEEHYVSDGALVPGVAVDLPTTDTLGIHACTQTGSVGGEGYLSRSLNELYLVLGCYDAAPGSPTVTSTLGRVIARIDSDHAIDTSTVLPLAFANQGSIFSVTSSDGIDLWAAGAPAAGNTNGGVWYAKFGSTSGENQLLSNPASVHNVEVQVSNVPKLFGTSDGGFQNVFGVGVGPAVFGPQTATALPGMPTAGTSAPDDFAFFDLSATVQGADVLYVADERAVTDGGGIQKWTLPASNGTWTLSATFSAPTVASGYRGMTAFLVPGTTAGCGGSTTCVEVLAVTAATSGNEIVAFVDPNTGGAVSGVELGVTAPAGGAYRGIALAPHPALPDPAFATHNNGFSVAGVTPKPCFQGLSFGTANTSNGFIGICTEDQGVWVDLQGANVLSTQPSNEAITNQDGTVTGQKITNLRGHAINVPNGSPASVALTDPDTTSFVNGWRSNSFQNPTVTWPTAGGGGQTQYSVSGVSAQMFSIVAGSGSSSLVAGWHPALGPVVYHGNLNTGVINSSFLTQVSPGLTGTVTSIGVGGQGSLPSSDEFFAVYGQQGDTLQTGTGSPANGGGIYWSCNLAGNTAGGTFVEHDNGIADSDKPLVYSLAADNLTNNPNATRTSCTGSGTVTGFVQVWYAALRGGGAVYKTTDGGATWLPANAGLPVGIEVRQIAIDVSINHDLLFAATSDGVYKSVDAGAHWTPMGLQGKSVRSVAISTNHTFGIPRVFAAVDDGVGLYSAP